MRVASPPLEPRSEAELLAALERRLPAYTPAWKPGEDGPGAALLRVYARFLRTLADRVDAAPDKAELAFLDLLGIDLMAAQAARTPVVFGAIPGAGDGRAPAGTRIGARGGDPSSPLVFETERAVGLAQARLAEVRTVWPGRDAHADHTQEAIGGRPFTLWRPLARIPHELFVGHESRLALAGSAVVRLDVRLATPGDRPVALVWEWWDGERWRGFKDTADRDDPDASFDGTAGLTRSGTVVLRSDCAESKTTTVGGWTTHWLRARVRDPLPPETERRLPEVDRILLRTGIERLLVKEDGACVGGLVPERGFAEREALDLSKRFYPLGRGAGAETAFYLACEEAFSRSGAEVTLCVARAVTDQDEADGQIAGYEVQIQQAKAKVDAIRAAAQTLAASLDDLVKMPAGPLRNDPNDPVSPFDETALAAALQRTREALQALRAAAAPAQAQEVFSIGAVANTTGAAAPPLFSVVPPWSQIALVSSAVASVAGALVILDVAKALRRLATAPANPAMATDVDTLETLLGNLQADFSILLNGGFPDQVAAAVRIAGSLPGIAPTWARVAADLGNWPGTLFLESGTLFSTARTRFADLRNRITAARNALTGLSASAKAIAAELEDLSPITVAAAAGVTAPKLQDPQLTWEYWDGRRWRSANVAGPAGVRNLLASGEITFTVPEAWTPSTWNDVEARWLRARLASGSYARVRVVNWLDSQTKEIKFTTIVEPRPPALESLFAGYRWASAPAPAERCLAHNDFRWDDRTEQAAWHGDAFVPFHPTDDAAPALYLGFDGPLPADRLGVLLDAEESPEIEAGPPLVWERWDGARWARLRAEDGTDALAAPGIVSVLWPGDDEPAPAEVLAAAGREIRLADARAAARYAPGDRVWVEADGRGEAAIVAGVAGEILQTAAPLARERARATVRAAGNARFGTPRTWIRARLRSDGEPLRARMRGIHPNAVWAAQVETVEDELLGSGTGEPRQVVFLTRTPVLPGELVEVRELEGGRAAVEYPLLVESLARAGISEDALRVVSDPKTAAVREVWVPWSGRPSLAFSGPEDRHYTLERTRGRLVFGDGRRGAKPPPGPDNVRARRYRTGGGERGNVGAGSLRDVLSGVLVEGVTNPRPAEGGAESEPASEVLERGPLALRHRRQAITAADAEALALESTRAVALARGVSRPGGVTVAIVPRSLDPRPEPTLELRRRVRAFLRSRVPAALAGSVDVVGPLYVPVGVAATIVPADPGAAGPAVAAARDALALFLHPLTGGPEGRGWPFGRDIHLSDVAALLARLPGVDVVRELALVVDGSPQGTAVAVQPDRLVCAGDVDVQLGGTD
jgi:hypothetical protein